MAAGDRTKTFDTDATPPDEAVVAQSYCREVWITENALAATLDYNVRDPYQASPQIHKAAGTTYIFKAQPGAAFVPGAIVGYVAAIGGALTMMQEEK